MANFRALKLAAEFIYTQSTLLLKVSYAEVPVVVATWDDARY